MILQHEFQDTKIAVLDNIAGGLDSASMTSIRTHGCSTHTFPLLSFGVAGVTHPHWLARHALSIEQWKRVLRAGLAEDLPAASAVMLTSRQIELPLASCAVGGNVVGCPDAWGAHGVYRCLQRLGRAGE